MSEPLWLYKWIDSTGKIHITTDYHEANEAIHLPYHPHIVGCRVREPLPIPDLPDRPCDPVEPDDEDHLS